MLLLWAWMSLVGAWPTPRDAIALAAAPQGSSKVNGAAYWAGSENEDSAVIQVTYTVGASGHKLTWRPYRPSPENSRVAPAPDRNGGASASKKDGKAAVSAERTASFDAVDEGPVQPDPRSPFSDPFEDKTRLTQRDPSAKLHDDALEKPAPKLSPPEVLPQTAAEKPVPKAESSEESRPIGGKELEEALAAGPQIQAGKCPSPRDLKPISKVGYRITPEKGELPQECSLGDDQFRPRIWTPITFTWTASALCHKPLYFEEAQLERYGHTWGLCLQPVVSAAHFFVTVPIMPYLMGLNPPCECIYTLGYYRPGSCAPYMLDPLPLSVRAGLWEAGAWTGAAFVFP